MEIKYLNKSDIENNYQNQESLEILEEEDLIAMAKADLHYVNLNIEFELYYSLIF